MFCPTCKTFLTNFRINFNLHKIPLKKDALYYCADIHNIHMHKSS